MLISKRKKMRFVVTVNVPEEVSRKEVATTIRRGMSDLGEPFVVVPFVSKLRRLCDELLSYKDPVNLNEVCCTDYTLYKDILDELIKGAEEEEG